MPPPVASARAGQPPHAPYFSAATLQREAAPESQPRLLPRSLFQSFGSGSPLGVS